MKSSAIVAMAVVAMVVAASALGAMMLVNDDKPSSDSETSDSELSPTTTTSSGGKGEFTVVLKGNTGAELSGSGTYTVGTKATISATCDSDTEFVAWLDSDGNVVSSNARYSFTVNSSGTVTLFASCLTNVDWSDGAVQLYSESGWKSASWTIYQYADDDSDKVTKIGTSSDGTYSFSDTGRYKVVIDAIGSDGSSIEMVTEIVVDGTVFEYTWTYEYKSYTVETNIGCSDYQSAVNDSVTRSYCSDGSNALAFVTAEEDCIEDIADQISSQLERYNVTDDSDVANIVLDLVQMSIVYTADSDQYGESEYWAYPVETLYSCKGDCEDTTFLFASIMKAMGYDTLVCYAQCYDQYSSFGHAFAMVQLDSCSGGTGYKISDGESSYGTYYYCETTLDDSFDSCNVGCSITSVMGITYSYCYLTDDSDSTPTAYSIQSSEKPSGSGHSPRH